MLSSATMQWLAFAALATALAVARQTSPATPVETGQRLFEQFCSKCHGADGRGGERGPNIIDRLAFRNDQDLAALIRDGLPSAGMPGMALPPTASRSLVQFVRQLQTQEGPDRPRVRFETTKGTALEGIALNRGDDDLQVLADDGRVRLLRTAGGRVREVTSDVDWPTYHGQFGGNRYSALNRINRANVATLAPAWVFPLAGSSRLEVTPVVVDGIMYVTSVNECVALDAGNGREIWRFKRPRTKGLAGDAAGGINRGVAVAGDRLFMVTDHAHLLALNRFTGTVLWETVLADWQLNYGATSAPLAIGSLVVSGTSGGDEGIRGFLAAYDQATGKEAWRVWSVPARGEPGSETWKGKDIDHPCASMWLTGTYDPELDLLYWPTGNPCPDHDGSQRIGDNLYSDSVLAIQAATGKRAWYFQVHAARRLGLGRAAAAGARRHDVGRTATQAFIPCESQRLLLHPRSHERGTAVGEALCEESDVGERYLSGWPAAAESRSDAVEERYTRLSGGGRRNQLVLDVVQRRDRPLLRADAREVQHLHNVTRDVAGRTFGPTGARPRTCPARRRRRFCGLSTCRAAQSRGKCRRRAPPTPGAGPCRRREASCSTATMAVRSPRSMRRPASVCGDSPPTCCGRRHR